MNIIRAIHQTALDMNALAELSKAKGLHNDAKGYYLKAFDLEKKAAFMTSSKDDDPDPHFLFLRGAAALAYKAGLYKESERLIQLCLSENPPPFIIEDLAEITDLIKKELTLKEGQEPTFIEGHLTKVNTEENEITVKDKKQEHQFAIIVPQDQFMDVIKNYLSKKVLIEVRQTNHGIMMLENIKAAA